MTTPDGLVVSCSGGPIGPALLLLLTLKAQAFGQLPDFTELVEDNAAAVVNISLGTGPDAASLANPTPARVIENNPNPTVLPETKVELSDGEANLSVADILGSDDTQENAN